MKSIILGAGGHAKEVFNQLSLKDRDNVVFFDNTENSHLTLFDKKVVKTNEYLSDYSSFYLGVGGVKARRILTSLGLSYGLQWLGVRSRSGLISDLNTEVEETVDIMYDVIVSPSVQIGKGSLLNQRSSVHHDCKIGSFCEISPNALLLGGVTLGNNVFIGAGAIVLPNVSIGDGCIIGAGAVVTKNVAPLSKVYGVPAKAVIF